MVKLEIYLPLADGIRFMMNSETRQSPLLLAHVDLNSPNTYTPLEVASRQDTCTVILLIFMCIQRHVSKTKPNSSVDKDRSHPRY